MEKTSDGFKIAEEDLSLRGPGEFFGIRQSGFPDFRVAHLVRDTRILTEARKEAFRLVGEDPDLRDSSHRTLREELRRRWSGRLELGTIS
jgi:ATP-dependent DNA helicase RecG